MPFTANHHRLGGAYQAEFGTARFTKRSAEPFSAAPPVRRFDMVAPMFSQCSVALGFCMRQDGRVCDRGGGSAHTNLTTVADDGAVVRINIGTIPPRHPTPK